MLKQIVEHLSFLWRWARWPQLGKSVGPRRRTYRLELISESSLRTLHALRLSKLKLILLTLGAVGAIAALMFVLLTLTPMRHILPAHFTPRMRDAYVDLARRADSLELTARVNDAYVDNIVNILTDNVQAVDSALRVAQQPIQAIPVDSLMPASEAEKQFVENYQKTEEYNLSVLSPIAAETMVFYPPVSGVAVDASTPVVTVVDAQLIPVSATYRGTVVSVNYDAATGYTILIQHPSEFISTYAGLTECFVTKGRKVEAGSRIGLADGSVRPMTFELWHAGVPVAPSNHISF